MNRIGASRLALGKRLGRRWFGRPVKLSADEVTKVRGSEDLLTPCRQRYDLAIVRSGRAYALIPRNGAADTTSIELYSIAGNRCGKVTLPIGGLRIGFDGTVIAASGDGGCTKTWWTGLLK